MVVGFRSMSTINFAVLDFFSLIFDPRHLVGGPIWVPIFATASSSLTPASRYRAKLLHLSAGLSSNFASLPANPVNPRNPQETTKHLMNTGDFYFQNLA